MTIPKSIKRLRPKRGLGAGYTRTRRVAADKVRKLAEERAEQAREAAKQEMARAVARSARNADMSDQKYRHAVIASVARAARGSLRAKGIENITVDYGVDTHLDNVDAWTDFERIVVRWPADRIPVSLMKHQEVLGQVRVMRGVFRHETGHIEHTTPWDVICKAAGLSTYDTGLSLMNNVLEDQRMEGLVVENTPKAVDDFKAMVLEVVLNRIEEGSLNESDSWGLLAGRDYMPKRLRKLAVRNWDARYGEGAAQAWQDIVDEYIAATTPEELGQVTVKASDWVRSRLIVLPTLDGHTRQRGYSHTDQEWADHSRTQARQPGTSQFRQNWNVEDDKTNINWGSSGAEGGQSNTGSGPRNFSEAVSRELDEVRKNDTVDREMAELVAGANQAAQVDGLPNYDGPTQDMTPDQLVVAQAIATGMEQALTSYLTQVSPVWLQRQEQGIVDALAYRTAGKGLRDYRRQLQVPPQENPLDVHLSLISDCSGSMGGNMEALSQVMYGTALCAEKVGIGTSLGLWSNGKDNYRVWQDGSHEPVIFPSMGGTDPTAALDDLDNHNQEGAGNHLVLIFTDGAWGNFPSLQQWAGDGRTIVLVRYGYYEGEFQGDMGADEHIQISNVLDLSGELTDALSGVLSSATGGWD